MIDTDRLHHLGVPAGVASAICWPSFELDRPVIAAATTFARSGHPLLVLAGPTQVGKSCAAAVAMVEARSPGRQGRCHLLCEPGEPGAFRSKDNGMYYRMQTYTIGDKPLPGLWLHAPQAHDSIFVEAFWTTARRSAFLVLDDLGLEPQGSPRVRDRLVGLLVERYDASRATVITTNLDIATFKATYCQAAGTRFGARISNSGAWVQVAGGCKGRAAP